MKIMVGYDSSKVAKTALDLAVMRVKSCTGKLFVVSSMDKGTIQDIDVIKQMEKNLKQIEDELLQQGVSCETHLLVRGMTPGEDIVTYAQENSIDEIVIGIQRRSKVGKILFGSNAQYIILQAPCPVVTVK